MKKFICLALLALFTVPAFSADFILLCDTEDDGKEYVTVSSVGTKASVFLFGESVSVKASLVAPLVKGDLAKMDKVTLSDATSSIAFRIDGQDVYGKKRLGIKFSTPNGTAKLSSCVEYKAPGVGFSL